LFDNKLHLPQYHFVYYKSSGKQVKFVTFAP
jgi:hypothetical protein